MLMPLVNFMKRYLNCILLRKILKHRLFRNSSGQHQVVDQRSDAKSANGWPCPGYKAYALANFRREQEVVLIIKSLVLFQLKYNFIISPHLFSLSNPFYILQPPFSLKFMPSFEGILRTGEIVFLKGELPIGYIVLSG